MDDIGGQTQTLPADGSEQNCNNPNDKRHCVSLPSFFDSELCTLGARPGMECLPLRSPPGACHYHVTDQTKSLQELQNEVGALLEFRDLVIETFPDLKNKMASISASSTITGLPSSSLASRREWEPGIRVRRKLVQKETADTSSSSLIRSRSNSHSGKKEPKSGEGNNGSVVQDSGFSTETSSSKETHSASSTSGGVTAGPSVANNSVHRPPMESDDELWNLLDVIHRKSTRIREEVEHLQQMERNHKSSGSNGSLPDMFQVHLNRINKEDIQILRKERDRLLDKLAEMEAETLAGRIKSNKLEFEVKNLMMMKRELEEQLRAALNQKLELNSRLHELTHLYDDHSNGTSETSKPRIRVPLTTRKTSSPDITSPQHISNGIANRITAASNTFTPVIVKSSQQSSNYQTDAFVDAKQQKNDFNLGRLDGLVSSPNRSSKVRVTDSKKIAAILLETNIVELQRHLLTITVQNQVLTQKVEQATKSRIGLIKRLDKAREEIEDLRFQLEERNIELEGTRAQLRVLESKTNKSEYSPEHHSDSHLMQTQVSTPSMKAMIPLAMDDLQNHSSSTESAHDQTERDSSNIRIGPDTPKRRPSKIPLPGTKGYLAPKPPTGRNFVSPRSPSGPPSNKSLSKSTGSLVGRSGPSSVRKDTSPSLVRPDSAQSLRKESSLGNTSRNSSIPVSSAKSSPTRTNASPTSKSRRESLTSRVRNMDSLSRIHSSPHHSNTSASTTPTNSHTNLYKPNSKKDLSSSFSNGQIQRDRKQNLGVPMRRVSSASINRGTDLPANVEPVEKMHNPAFTPNLNPNIMSSSQLISNRELIREYLYRARGPPAIFQTPKFTTYEETSPKDLVNMAYRHPLLLQDEMANTDEDVGVTETNGGSKYSELSSIELLENGSEDSRLHSIKDHFNKYDDKQRNVFSSINDNASTDEADNCKLIGKPTASLVKTWERLSKWQSKESVLSNDSDRNSVELGPRGQFTVRSRYPPHKRTIESDSSEHFYDSIDNKSVYTTDDNDVQITSICNDDITAGGEGMAEPFQSFMDYNMKAGWPSDNDKINISP